MLGCMLMYKGMAHADPHAGNLVYEREKNELLIIDWGVAVQLEAHERRSQRELVSGLATGDLISLREEAAKEASDKFTNECRIDLGLW